MRNARQDAVDPDRFAPEKRPDPEQMTYFPFGAGPRSCIGNLFAIQELVILTVLFYRNFRFTVEPVPHEVVDNRRLRLPAIVQP